MCVVVGGGRGSGSLTFLCASLVVYRFTAAALSSSTAQYPTLCLTSASSGSISWLKIVEFGLLLPIPIPLLLLLVSALGFVDGVVIVVILVLVLVLVVPISLIMSASWCYDRHVGGGGGGGDEHFEVPRLVRDGLFETAGKYVTSGQVTSRFFVGIGNLVNPERRWAGRSVTAVNNFTGKIVYLTTSTIKFPHIHSYIMPI